MPLKQFLKSEQGRSLTEMLGVLTVIGILTIGAVAGYRYAVDKTQANTISRDARAVYTVFHGSANIEINPAEPWEQVSDYTPASGKQFWAQRTQTGDFVLVEEVTKGVCNRLLDMQGAQVSFFDEEGFRFTECTDTNNMVFSFNGESLKPSCDTTEKCGAGFNGYCHNEGICIECPEDFVADTQNKKCNQVCTETEHVCESSTGNWCCSPDLVCNYAYENEEDKCIESDGTCSWIMGKVHSQNYQADCSAAVGKVYSQNYQADCSAAVGKVHSTEYIADCSADIPSDFAETGNITINDSACGTNQYCALFWKDQSWDFGTSATTFVAGDTGTIYGKCEALTDYESFPPLITDEVMMAEKQECPAGQYCYLNWQNKECIALTAGISGEIYGSCVPLDSTTATCVYK